MRSALVRISNIVLLFLLATSAQRAEAFLLPDTGQTQCYSDRGRVITCPAPDQSLAQDGSYTINPPSYSVTTAATVFDNNTWLMWQREDDGVIRSWDQAISYCEDLSLDGYTDWRLPTVKELESIVNYGQTSPAIDSSAFPNTKASNYWTSSNYPACDISRAYYVHFGNGIEFTDNCTRVQNGNILDLKNYQGGNVNFIETGYPGYSFYARCVRGGPLTYNAYVDNGNGTVTDTKTGLQWQPGEAGAMKWSSAVAYCEGLSLGGSSDWRLPNARELESLADAARQYPSIDTAFFPEIKADPNCSATDVVAFFYWTSTANLSNVNNRLTVTFERNFVASHDITDRSVYARCVRGGQPLSLDDREIKADPGDMDFLYVTTGETRSMTLSILNGGRSEIIIGTIIGPDAPFSMAVDNCSGQTLPALASCSVTLEFNSSVDGTFTGSLTIPSNDADIPNVAVTLKARATASGFPFFLPDTGLTACYDSSGSVISCPSPGQTLAQDGSYTSNSPSYTANGDGTVSDSNTRLTWQQQDDGILRNWQDADAYCESLSLGGYSDWRLPTKRELFSVVDFGRYSPSINTSFFPNTKTDNYWTSSSDAANAWKVYFGVYRDDGCDLYGYSHWNNYYGVTTSYGSKSEVYYARCVRGEELPSNVFSDNKNGTVTDAATGLTWQQTARDPASWENAISYCEALSLGGHSDWRLPDIKELESLTGGNVAEFFPDLTCAANSWSSTSIHNIHCSLFWAYHEAYVSNAAGGIVYLDSINQRPKTETYPVRCVRGGNIMPPPTLTGTVTDSYTGLPLANVAVSVTDSGNSVYTAATGTDGKYTITSLATGAFTAAFTKTGYVTYTGSGTIASDHKTTFNVQMIEIKPLLVTITSPQNGAVLNTSQVTVTGTINNTATVTVNGVQAAVTGGTFTATLSLLDGPHPITATAHDVYDQTANQSIDITIITKGTATGTVTDSDTGLTLASATVTIVDSLPTTLTALTDGNGTFTISNVTQGQFSVTITKDDYSTYRFTGTMTAGQTMTVKGSINLQPPSLTVPAAVGVNVNFVTITWTTDQASDSLVTYGTDTSYGSSASDAALTRNHSIGLTGLASGTTYHFRVSSTNSHGYASSSADGIFTTVTPPVISALVVSAITTSTATVTWTTDQPTDSRVEYGTTSSYGSLVSEPTLTTNHVISLTGLSQKTLYHFKAVSANSDGISAASSDKTFWTRSSAFSATMLGDYGNITVMEVTGNYDAKNPDGTVNDLPRQEIAKEFLRTHEDNYDFLVVLSNFDFTMPAAEAKGFYLEVRNDVQGIGMQTFDNSVSFGSNGKLQGTVDVGNIAGLGVSPFDQSKFEETLDLLAHEQLHRWGALVKFKNPDGTLNTGLLGKDGTHWSYLLDSDGSVLYGNDWQDNKNGTFTSTGGGKYYTNLDLYLMGLIDRTKVPQKTLIENAAIDPTKLPEPGAIISGTTKTVTIDDIIAAEGERVPGATDSQKAFKTAFIFITQPGTFTGNETASIETLRNAWAGRFSALTGGKASIAEVTPGISISINFPANGATISRPFTTVKGYIINSTGNETGVTVNSIAATVYGSQFIADKVPVAEGPNTITVTATDTAGNTATSSIAVTASTTGNYITLTANIESGIAPLETFLRIDGLASSATPTISSTGPAPVDFSNCTSFDDCSVKMTVEGVYYFTATGTGTDGNTYQDTIAVTVLSRSQMDVLLKARWNEMKDALVNGNIPEALNHIHPSTRQIYSDSFTALQANISAIAASLQDIELVYATDKFVKYRIRREQIIDEQNQTITYYIYFAKDSAGLWMIDEF